MEILSWILTTIALLGAYFNARQYRICWPLWWCSNCGYVALSLSRGQWAEVILFGAFLVTSIMGWNKTKGTAFAPAHYQSFKNAALRESK